MNRKELEQILKEELEEGFFSNMAAKLRGAKDGGWEAVAAQGDGEVASSEMAGAPSDAKIPVKELIGKLAAAGLPPDVSQQLFDEIVKQLKDTHGYGDAAIKEQAGALRGVAAQQSARTTSNMPSRKKTLDLDAVKIPKNMRKKVEQVLSDFFSKYGFTSVSTGLAAAHETPSKAAVEPDRASEKEEEPEDDQQRDDEQDGEETEEKVTKFSNNEVSLGRDDTIEGIAMKVIGVKEKPTQRSDKEKFRELSFVREKVMNIFKQAARNVFGNKVKIRAITEEERIATLSGKGYEDSPSTSISKFTAEMLGLKEVPKPNKGDKQQYRKFSTAAYKLKLEIHSLLKKEFGLKNTYVMEESVDSQDPLLERWQRISGINKKVL